MSKDLLCHYVKTHFGPAYEAIIVPLIENPELQLGELAKQARIEPEELRPMLILLLKCDIVEYVEKVLEASGSSTSIVLYKLNVENVLNIGLFPQYLNFLEERFSILAKSLAETLMLNGKMSVRDCIDWTKENIGLELQDQEVKM
jgi:hypothetical protein